MQFRVHFIHDDVSKSEVVETDTPDKAAHIIRKKYVGSLVKKVKAVK